MRRISPSVGAAAAAFVAALMLGMGSPAPAGDAKPAAFRTDGRELFTREWVPGDKRSHGGDGLGPLFNDSSCVACHNQGGVGGGGPASKNAIIITAFRNVPVQQRAVPRPARTLPEELFRGLFGDLDQPAAATAPATPAATPTAAAAPAVSPEQLERERKELAKLHPGLATSASVVLHRNGTYAEYEAWRQQFAGFGFNSNSLNTTNDIEFFAQPSDEPRVKESKDGNLINASRQRAAPSAMQQLRNEAQLAAQRRVFNQNVQHGNFAIVRSERNTTSLFGVGLIDAIPVSTLEELEKQQAEKNEVSGRVSRLKDGKAGRFGWKGQTASLDDFVLTACAVELGLNVPGHAQAGVPHKTDYRTAGLDLTADECAQLVSFVRELPAPKQRPLTDGDRDVVAAGRKQFDAVGCAACHVPDVDEAQGIYSDLLLHDLGPELGDSGSSYGVFVPDSTPDGTPAPVPSIAELNGRATGAQPAKVIGATRQEWRTPPLWGVRDSAPYLHDGRAETLEQAIAFHGGEATKSVTRFFELSAEERFQVVAFLKSLTAPEAVTVTAQK